MFQDAAEAGGQQATQAGKRAGLDLAAVMEGAQHPPLLLRNAEIAQRRPEPVHHRFARPEQRHRQRAGKIPHRRIGKTVAVHPPNRAGGLSSSATLLASMPMPAASTSTLSPGTSHFGGSKKAPAPVGVPVEITSPGFSAVKAET